MDRKFYLIAVAGGSGTRMGSGIPKQFLEIREKAILQRTLEKFINAWPGISVITVLPRMHIDTWKNYCLSRNFTYPQQVIAGGVTRFHSVRNALAKVPVGAVVAIHDGVRPLLSIDMISRMFRQMEHCRGLIPVVPVTDTLKALVPSRDENGSRSLSRADFPDPDRGMTFAAQTPQVFMSEDIKAAYDQAYDLSFTDDASVAENAGLKLDWCLGERLNLKITTPEDMILAEAVIRNLLK